MRVHHISSAYHQTTLYQALLAHYHAEDLQQVMYVPREKGSKEKLRPGPPGVEVVTTQDYHEWERFVYQLKRKHVFDGLMKHGLAQADLLHSHFLFSNGGVAYKAWQATGVPYIVAVRKTDLNTFFDKQPHLRGTGRRILQNASAVIFLTPAAREELLSRWIPEEMRLSLREKCHVIPNGVDDFWHAHVFKEKEIPAKLTRMRLLFVGEITKNKNVESIYASVLDLRAKGWEITLDIVGDGRHMDALRQVVTSGDGITFHGKITDKDKLMALYRQADVFVMPSFSETFGLVYAEALTQGLPYICSRNQGIDGTFPDGEVGYACDPHDPASLVARLLDIAENYREMSGAALTKAPLFDWSRIAHAYEDLYREILQKK